MTIGEFYDLLWRYIEQIDGVKLNQETQLWGADPAVIPITDSAWISQSVNFTYS